MAYVAGWERGRDRGCGIAGIGVAGVWDLFSRSVNGDWLPVRTHRSSPPTIRPDAIPPTPRRGAVVFAEVFRRSSPPRESKKRQLRPESKHGNVQRGAARPVRRTFG